MQGWFLRFGRDLGKFLGSMHIPVAPGTGSDPAALPLDETVNYSKPRFLPS